MREYGSSAPSPNSLSAWLHEFQERETMTHRPRSGRSAISNDDVDRFKNDSSRFRDLGDM